MTILIPVLKIIKNLTKEAPVEITRSLFEDRNLFIRNAAILRSESGLRAEQV